MSLLISVLYLCLNIAILVLAVAIIAWVLRWLGIPIDPTVQKVAILIIALIIIILIVSWLAGIIPSKGLFGNIPLGKFLIA